MQQIAKVFYQSIWLSITGLMLVTIWFATSTNALAAVSAPSSDPKVNQFQPLQSIETVAKQYLVTQTQGMSLRSEVSVSALDKFLKIERCDAMEAFIPTGNKAWGKTTVGVKCTKPVSWTLFMQAQVSVFTKYVSTAKPLTTGQTISADDITLLEGDLSMLPSGVLTEPNDVIGKTIASAIPSGMPLKVDFIKAPFVISQGQSIKVVSNGKGFSVSNDAQALNNAREGQLVKAKTASGTIISGIAQASGQVYVIF